MSEKKLLRIWLTVISQIVLLVLLVLIVPGMVSAADSGKVVNGFFLLACYPVAAYAAWQYTRTFGDEDGPL